MKMIKYYLFLGMLMMGVALAGCSDDDAPEPEPEPPVPPIEEPDPEPEPESDTLTVPYWTTLDFANYTLDEKSAFRTFEYDTLGRPEAFKALKGKFQGATYYTESVKVNWGEWGSKEVVMTYDKEGVAGDACTATYTLNDKGWMEKVVVMQGSAKIEEYVAEYTETGFTLYEVKAGGKEKLYSAAIASGGNYGDWTVTEAAGAKVTVDYEDFDGVDAMPEHVEGCLDILLTSSYACWLMPERVLWAHVAGIMPGQTKMYNHPKITYEGNTEDLYEIIAEVLVFGEGVSYNLSEYTLDDPVFTVWQSAPEFTMKWDAKTVIRPGKKK